MAEELTALPLERCPCGGALRLIVTTEDRYSLSGELLDVHEQSQLHCMDCDDWQDDRIPRSVSVEHYNATIAAADNARLGMAEP